MSNGGKEEAACGRYHPWKKNNRFDPDRSHHPHVSAILTKEETETTQFDFKSYRVHKANSVHKTLDDAISLRDPPQFHEAMIDSLLPTASACAHALHRRTLCRWPPLHGQRATTSATENPPTSAGESLLAFYLRAHRHGYFPRPAAAIDELASSIRAEGIVSGQAVDLAYTLIADVGFDNREGTLGILEYQRE
ncbi:geranylgeranyl pyrophosphate synthase, chloroplastic-like [Actinidia eriantha]|uniref:geranylgeranyl pyrophosphate synthase, chloroplastic-like n=1 Tax=Actinidia eriantha TaxID=165200 RepID=UPI002584F01B|nr:geranylgeranyl pyrophosphate synthase, chloroplastic-like [Actinidia eriantha]